jgi:DNA anti-recombination protein RmuC
MYVPIYDLLEDTLRGDPDLLAHGIAKRVVIATPTTAIALLLAVKHGASHRQVYSTAPRETARSRAFRQNW